MRLPIASLALVAALTGCATPFRPFPLRAPMERDEDAHPFAAEPDEYYSSFLWDGADQMVFRPIARFWAVDPGGEAVNVNALDEVPDSSWFVNRLGQRAMTPEEVAEGPCKTPPLDPAGPWIATGAKPNGANPGFIIKGNDGHGYLLKFDGVVQGPRATAADVSVSKLYHAVGFNPPCNRVVFFDRSIIEISEDAKSENEAGDKVKMSEADLDKVFAKAIRLPDGRYRASSSLFLDGKPIGPFRYEGTRDDDPNDVVPHQDRRELRGHRLLAAWTGHTDAREQNTLDMFVKVNDAAGYVRHHIIDFGDCLGSIWEPPGLGRRVQHEAYFDGPEIFEDWITLGIPTRPWDRLRFGPSGKVFAYFDIEELVPEDWEPGYPNPAMLRMTERDGAWMARKLAHFTKDHLRAAIGSAEMQDEALDDELLRLLWGRRQRVLSRYLTRLSPLSDPEVRVGASQSELCLDDLAIVGGVATASQRRYSSRAYLGLKLRPTTPTGLHSEGKSQVCLTLPKSERATPKQPDYLIVDVIAQSGGSVPAPTRVHLYHLGGGDYRIVGLERPEDADPPAG
ncbi:MAG: hypothetical protein KC731_05440 [Myxococcales bacterium]|nr:hypothetical protein [Myxococcales bacterium]